MPNPTNSKQHRRRFLGGLGAAGAAFVLPFLQRETWAQTGVSGPQRLLILQSPDGRAYELWRPTGSGADFQFGPTMQPFEPLKSKAVLISGLDHLADDPEPHCGGLVQWMTGMAGNFDGNNYTSGKIPSVDQLVATNAAFVGSTRFPSLQMAGDMTTEDGDRSHRYLSWAGNNLPLPAEFRPLENYKRIFEGITLAPTNAGSTQANRTVLERKSVLDLLLKDAARMAAVVPIAQKDYFAAHVEGLRSLERNLSLMGGSPAAGCSSPDSTQYPTGNSSEQFPAYMKANLEIIRLAFACDLTRVITFMSSPTTSGLRHQTWNPAIPNTEDHHASSHDSLIPNLTAINAWYSERMAELVTALSQTADGAGSLLDSMLVLYGSELGDGREHSHRNVPFVLFGGAGGKLATGRYLNFVDNQPRSSNDLWISVLGILGMPTTTVGDPAKCGGPVPGL